MAAAVVKASAANRILADGQVVGGRLSVTGQSLTWKRSPLEWHKPSTSAYEVDKSWISSCAVRPRHTLANWSMPRRVRSADLVVVTADGAQEAFTVMDPAGWCAAVTTLVGSSAGSD